MSIGNKKPKEFPLQMLPYFCNETEVSIYCSLGT